MKCTPSALPCTSVIVICEICLWAFGNNIYYLIRLFSTQSTKSNCFQLKYSPVLDKQTNKRMTIWVTLSFLLFYWPECWSYATGMALKCKRKKGLTAIFTTLPPFKWHIQTGLGTALDKNHSTHYKWTDTTVWLLHFFGRWLTLTLL